MMIFSFNNMKKGLFSSNFYFHAMRSYQLIAILLISFVVKGFSQSGIPAIDTLPMHAWDISTPHKSKPMALGFAILTPGGGHYYTEHYVRAGFITGIQSYLLFEIFSNYDLRIEQRSTNSKYFVSEATRYADSLALHFTDASSLVYADQVRENLESARIENDFIAEAYGLRRSQIAWMSGMHLYSVLDVYGILYHKGGRVYEEKSALSALWRAALIPGWGQIYNREYGKAGLLWMSMIGSYASFHARQETVEYYLERLRTARAENDTFSLAAMEEKVVFFRKKRNQYIWGPFLFYIYSLADASVDALLSDFDSPVNMTLAPMPMDPGLSLEFTWNF